jgi:hypothetical protein
MQACPIQLLALKELVQDFARATGLQVNFSKTAMMPINIDEQMLGQLANTFGCAMGTLPFPYLRLPLGTTRPSVQDLSPIVDQIERRLNASARFLGYGGRLELVNSVLSSLPLHYLCSLKVHKTVIKLFDRSRRHCLWAKKEDDTSCNALAAWSVVCRPKKHGGLGIRNLELQNKALLLKQLHKFYCKESVPWVQLVWSLYTQGAPQPQSPRGSFWWRDIFSLVGDYRSITSVQIGNGQSTLFWKDFWTNGQTLSEQFPRLFSFTLLEDVTVSDLALAPDLRNFFALPLSVEAHEEYIQIQQLLQGVGINASSMDSRSFAWGTEAYTPSKYYNFLFALVPPDNALRAIWKSKCMPKLRVFAWLLLKDRLNTKVMMIRKQWNVDSGPSCILCTDQVLETRDHLFFDCPFARSCWDMCQIHWNTAMPISQRFLEAKTSFAGPCFMEVAVCVAWNIWKERNDFIFNNRLPSFDRWKVRFQSDLMLHRYRVKEALIQPLIDWVLLTFV